MSAHECDPRPAIVEAGREPGDLVFVGSIGAPGRGQVWCCATCGREFLRLDRAFRPASELEPCDVVLQPWMVE